MCVVFSLLWHSSCCQQSLGAAFSATCSSNLLRLVYTRIENRGFGPSDLRFLVVQIRTATCREGTSLPLDVQAYIKLNSLRCAAAVYSPMADAHDGGPWGGGAVAPGLGEIPNPIAANRVDEVLPDGEAAAAAAAYESLACARCDAKTKLRQDPLPSVDKWI